MKRIQLRTCIVTKKKMPKSELARFAIDPDSQNLVLDEKGKMRSRGANLSLDLDVFDEAVKRGAFQRAFGREFSEENLVSARDNLIAYIEKFNFRKGRKNVSVRVKGDNIKLD